MNEICLSFDHNMQRTLDSLKYFYNLPNYAETFKRGIILLATAKNIEESHGKLIAKKDGDETIINIS